MKITEASNPEPDFYIPKPITPKKKKKKLEGPKQLASSKCPNYHLSPSIKKYIKRDTCIIAIIFSKTIFGTK